MKNRNIQDDPYEQAELCAAGVRFNTSYGTDSAIAVLCRGYGCMPEDVKGGKYIQVDHCVPQNVHLDPENDAHAEFIEALGLKEDALTIIKGKKVYAVTGSALIRAAFKDRVPESDIPLQDNIFNLVIMPRLGNGAKSNDLPHSLKEIRKIITYNAKAYLSIIEKMEAQAQPKASRLAANIGVPMEVELSHIYNSESAGPDWQNPERHLVPTGEFERTIDAFSKEFREEIWILDDARDLGNGYTSLPANFEDAHENGAFTLRILNEQENRIAHVLHAIEAVDDAADETQNHLIVPNVNLFDAFNTAAELMGLTCIQNVVRKKPEDRYYLGRLTAYFDEEMFVEGNARVADKLSAQGVVLEHGFTGSIVDTSKRFYDSVANLKKEFLPLAESLIRDNREQRIEESMAGIPMLKAA